MVRYILYFMIFSSIMSQDIRIMGTGLELDRMNDFTVIMKEFDKNALSIGLNENYFDSKINLLLDKNGTPASTTLTNNSLSIELKIINNLKPRNVKNHYYAFIAIKFSRPSGYKAAARKYTKVSDVWSTESTFVPMHGDLDRFKNEIMIVIENKINKFSNSLIKANNKVIY